MLHSLCLLTVDIWGTTETDTQQLTRADQVFTDLGGGADALAAAIGLVTAEKNTNPFANGNAQNVCGDPTLPVTPELRGITPLIDPAVDVDGAVAALSKSSAASPLAADGLSVFDLLDQAGLGNLVVSQAADGAAAGGANNNTQQANGQESNGQKANSQKANDQKAAAANDNPAEACDASNASATNQTEATGAANNKNGAAANDNNQGSAANSQQNATANGQAAGLAGADFGQCTPTITFQGGEGNRPDTEFTFQIADPLARGGQGEALNPDIITNALCNQLTNVCDANDAAVAACQDAKAQVISAGSKRDKSTADLFNSLLGFAGAVTNPAGGPANPPAAARSMRRGRRAL